MITNDNDDDGGEVSVFNVRAFNDIFMSVQVSSFNVDLSLTIWKSDEFFKLIGEY